MYRIMIVDDETSSQDIIKKYIETKLPSYQVCSVCSNGQEALEAFCKTPADIVLVDICMPLMDGLTLIEKLNEITHDYIPIIISGYGEFEYAKTAMHLGVAHYLLKPVDFKELTHSLEAAEHTLIFNRIAHDSLTWQDDDQESYLMNILLGHYTDSTIARKQFAGLGFPFPFENCNGLCIRISFSQTEQWAYGRDALYTAVCNMMNMLYTPLFLIPLFRKKNCCDYLFIPGECDPGAFEQLYENAFHILGIQISVCSISHFSSIEQLRTGTSTFYRNEVQGNPQDATAGTENENIQTTIETAIAYMKEHCEEDLTRDDMAKKVYMSGAHFSRCFKMVTQTSYKDYLTKIRMQKAIELLKTDMKIQDISQHVGYPNPNRFNINFRHYTSYTPSDYRSQVLKMM